MMERVIPPAALVNYGLTIGEAILMAPSASALSAVTSLLAVIFLKEKVARPPGLGAGLASLGSLATAFQLHTKGMHP